MKKEEEAKGEKRDRKTKMRNRGIHRGDEKDRGSRAKEQDWGEGGAI